MVRPGTVKAPLTINAERAGENAEGTENMPKAQPGVGVAGSIVRVR